MLASGLIKAIDDVDGVPAMGSSHTRVRAAFKDRRIEISMFLAFRAPKRCMSVEQTVIR